MQYAVVVDMLRISKLFAVYIAQYNTSITKCNLFVVIILRNFGEKNFLLWTRSQLWSFWFCRSFKQNNTIIRMCHKTQNKLH